MQKSPRPASSLIHRATLSCLHAISWATPIGTEYTISTTVTYSLTYPFWHHFVQSFLRRSCTQISVLGSDLGESKWNHYWGRPNWGSWKYKAEQQPLREGLYINLEHSHLNISLKSCKQDLWPRIRIQTEVRLDLVQARVLSSCLYCLADIWRCQTGLRQATSGASSSTMGPAAGWYGLLLGKLLPEGRTMLFVPAKQNGWFLVVAVETAETLIFYWRVPSRNDKPLLWMRFSTKASGSWVLGDCSGYWDLCR